MTKFKKILIWCLIHGKEHDLLTEKETQILASLPVFSALFPGINFYSITGFGQVLKGCARPALKKLFPELISIDVNTIRAEDRIEVGEFLSSKGYEWQSSDEWQEKFDKLLK